MTDRESQTTSWQVEATAAEAYEQYFVPAIFEPWGERLIEHGEPREGEHVLDVACGTGIVARLVRERVGDSGSVVGLDLNEEMLAVAQRTADAAQLRIEWRQGDATDLPFPNDSFDVVFCQQALQFFDEPVEAIGEMRRVLAKNGRVAFNVWRPLRYQSGYEALTRSLEEHIGAEGGRMMRSPFPDWEVSDIHRLITDGGFEDRTVTIQVGSVRYPSVEEFVRRELVSSPMATQLADTDVRDPVVHEAADAIGNHIDDDGVVLPVESYVVSAREEKES